MATAYYGDIQPDWNDVKNGNMPFLKKPGATPTDHDWGAIACWAWGLSRCIDYLVTDSDIDATRIVVFGHSRLGWDNGY